MSDTAFARTITEVDVGAMGSSALGECGRYGMTYGCNEDCPVLLRGECELQDSENAELYKRAKDSQ